MLARAMWTTKIPTFSRLNKNHHRLVHKLPPYLINTPPTRISTIPQGLRVATEEGFGEIATVGVWIDAGSAYEDVFNNGTAHFLEHMAFKGTYKREKLDLEIEIETMGASLNAYTSREQTVYVAQCQKGDTGTMIELISDILQNSELATYNIDSERSVILKEKEVVEESEEELLYDYMHAAAFQGSSLALTILGEVENIQSIKRNDLVKYITNNYTKERCVIVGAGAVKHEELVELTEKHFSSLSTSKSKVIHPQVSFVGSEIRLPSKKNNQSLAHVIYAFEGMSWSHPHYFTFMIIQAFIGNWDRNMGSGKHTSSRLADVASTHNLAHSFQTISTCYYSTGIISIYAEAPPENLERLTYEVIDEFRLIGQRLTEDELIRAKNKVKASFLMNLDSSISVAEDIGRQLLSLNRRLSPAELFLRIDAITLDDVMECLDMYFNDVSPVIIGMGNLQHLPKFEVCREWTNWQGKRNIYLHK